MNVSVLIPFRPGDPARERALVWCRARLDGRSVQVGDAPSPTFSKGAALRLLAATVDADVLVLMDADVWVPSRELDRVSALVANRTAAWGMPHRRLYRLSRRATMMLYGGRIGTETEPMALPAALLVRRAHDAPPGGGCVIVRHDDFDRVGGIDPRFVGYGGDDVSFARALDTLVGPCEQGDGIMWHAWHPPSPRIDRTRGSPANEQLAARYIVAEHDPEAMAALVAER